MTHIEQPHWADQALCAQIGGDDWFPEHGAFPMAPRTICGQCPCRRDCLDDAMTYELGLSRVMRYGIRAGLSPNKRWQLEPQWLAERSAA